MYFAAARWLARRLGTRSRKHDPVQRPVWAVAMWALAIAAAFNINRTSYWGPILFIAATICACMAYAPYRERRKLSWDIPDEKWRGVGLISLATTIGSTVGGIALHSVILGTIALISFLTLVTAAIVYQTIPAELKPPPPDDGPVNPRMWHSNRR